MKITSRLRSLLGFFKSRPYSLLILAWPVEWIWYGILNQSQTAETSHIISMSLDDSIPFCEYFIIPYVLWYFFIGFATFYTLWKSKKDFIHLSSMIYLGMFGSMIICTVYPSWHNLRPDLADMNNNIFTWMIKRLWEIDNPAVIFPSMHVLVAVLITIALIRADCMKGRTRWKVGFVIYTILVSASTVYTKQHSIKDVFFAFVFVVPYYLLTYYVIWPKKRWAKDNSILKKGV
ncbi:MAG: phosphatase PAP2 family protein [Eubacteriales bacterium]|nr:phosphatase PAP2 family protein [Eubacteriales bacterium]